MSNTWILRLLALLSLRVSILKFEMLFYCSFSFWMLTMQNTTRIFGGENFIEGDLITIKACVIFVKSCIQTKHPLCIRTCVIGGWIKQSVVQKQFIVKMI
jgi:hypothetical protein